MILSDGQALLDVTLCGVGPENAAEFLYDFLFISFRVRRAALTEVLSVRNGLLCRTYLWASKVLLIAQ